MTSSGCSQPNAVLQSQQMKRKHTQNKRVRSVIMLQDSRESRSTAWCFDVRALAAYAGVSERTVWRSFECESLSDLRLWLEKHKPTEKPVNGLIND